MEVLMKEIQMNLVIKPDVPNVNGITFKKSAVDKAIDEYNNIKTNKFGTIGYKNYGFLKLNDVAFEISGNIEENDGVYKCKIKILDTKEGKKLSDMLVNHNNYAVGFLMFGTLIDNVVENELSINHGVILNKDECGLTK